jgi:ATPase subunit of ABC transporter with duplicated ATPase domains
MPVISASSLSKSFGAQDVFAGVTCALAHSQHVALVGANGSGKTTLLRILAGLEESSGGQVHRARGITIGFLPQRADEELTSEQTVHEELLKVFAHLRAQAEELHRLEQAMADPNQYESIVEAWALTRMISSGRSASFPAGKRRACCWRGWSCKSPTCCCWTSLPITWTWKPWNGWRRPCAIFAAR